MNTFFHNLLSAARFSLALPVLLFAFGSQAAPSNITIYTNALDAAWVDWSWGTTVASTTNPAHSASNALSVTHTQAWAGFYLHTDSAVNAANYESLSFWIHGGNTGNQQLRIVGNADNSATYTVTATAGTWTHITVPLSALGNPATLSDLYWQDSTGAAQATFYLDDIELIAKSGSTPPGTGPALSIDVSANRHTISEDIYGMNFPDETLAAELHLPVARWGGNSTTRYNWQTSISNHTNDYFFENIPEGIFNPANLPNGSASDQFVDQNKRTGTKSLITVPLIGWTPKAASPSSHPYACGFKISKYGAQQSSDPYDTDCGNGIQTNGSTKITGNNPTDTSTAIDPSFVTGWINHLTGLYGTAANGGVAYYNLDNEPMLWNSTHRDVHPDPTTYDEIGTKTFQYAAAIKAADPAAKTLGPVLWGWCAYFYSALDNCGQGSTDYTAHGNKYFVPWYLEQMQQYEQQHSVRILDYLDLHFYPQANGVALTTAGNATTQALRLRSTHSLWDNTYIDESWISDTQQGGVAIRFIPRMKDWVNTGYPGTKLAVTEYNWGGLEHINGALTQADVLGIFGREGLDLATIWSPPTSSQPGAYAFRIYRNYDGLGHKYGDVGVQATSADQSQLSVYAAQRNSDNALTVVIINKTASDLSSAVTLAGLNLPSAATVYRYSASNLAAIEKLPDQALAGNGFTGTFPANSITLLDIKPSNVPTATLSINLTGTGSGTVTPDSGAIVWNSNTGTYTLSTPVTLTAAPSANSLFGGWTGCEGGSVNTCTVSTVADRTVSAQFTLNPTQYLLTAKAKGKGKTQITSSSGGIHFSYPTVKKANEMVTAGSTVTLSATGIDSVVAWSGDCSTINGSDCTINNMNSAKSATLTATRCTYSLSPKSKKFKQAGGTGTVKVTVKPLACSWATQSDVDWVTVPSDFTGTQIVTYTVEPNNTGLARKTKLKIAGKVFTVSQGK